MDLLEPKASLEQLAERVSKASGVVLAYLDLRVILAQRVNKETLVSLVELVPPAQRDLMVGLEPLAPPVSEVVQDQQDPVDR